MPAPTSSWSPYLLRGSTGFILTCLVYGLSTLSYVVYSGFHLLLIPWLPFALWRLFRGYRRGKGKRVARQAGILLALAGIWGREMVLHTSSPTGAYPNEVSVVSYNLYFRNTAMHQTTQQLLAQHADILVLQEVTLAWGAHLETTLPKAYPYSQQLAIDGTHGLAVYSRFPLVARTTHYNANDLPIAQEVGVQHPSQPFVLVNAHIASPAVAVEGPLTQLLPNLERNARSRAHQWSQITQPTGSQPQLVVGDLNTHRWEYLYQQMRREFTEAHAAAGSGFGLTFPKPSQLPIPIFRLDHAFLRGPSRFLDSEVLDRGTSDHLPIRVTLGLP